MGSESNDGWWESLFRRGDGSQAEAWNEQLGSDEDGSFSGQTGAPLTYSIYDEISNSKITFALVCSCDTQVIGLDYNSFFCPHCDRECHRGTKNCVVCIDYHLNLEDRLKMEDEDDADL
jgi:hypothetical protein